MAWWGRWRRRRRWGWWRRRGRRRLLPRRRRAAAGRRRRRYTVRRRRRGRRFRRRGYRRRLYIRKRRRRRKKHVLTQWNPPFVRRCYITGMLPVIISGKGTSSFNYALHADDYLKQPLSFGGGMSTITISLQVLYDEFTRHLNRWSYSNEQLDLARYRGCTLKVYRQPKVDFIMTFNTIPPMQMNELTAPNTHPGMLMIQKMKILIPSFETRPKGKKYKRVKIHPPKLFEDKWYSQSDLCRVPLVSLRFTAASFKYPFCSPQTVTPITTFQVLQEPYNRYIGFPITANFDTDAKTKFETWLYGTSTHYQAFATEAHLRPRDRTPQGDPIQNDSTSGMTFNPTTTQFEIKNNSYDNWRSWWTIDFYASKADSLYGYSSFTPKDQKGINNIKKIRDNNFKALTIWNSSNPNHINPTYRNADYPEYEYHCGYFSSMFLSPHRYQLQFKTAYFDCTYNPLNDHGQGNKIWFQYLTKPTTKFNEQQCKFVIQDIPMWAACHGYAEYIQSQLGEFQDHEQVGFVCMICPYTRPQMYNKTSPDYGYVVYDSLFGQGKMPDGTSQISRYWAQRWRIYLGFQLQVLNDISNSGPYAYRDEHQSTQLTMAYNFKFNWGGDMLFPQIIKNPCKDTGLAPPTGRLRRDVQVVNPLTVGPQWTLHPFDMRRGLYNQKAIKRVSQKPTDDELFIQLPKRPRFLTEPESPEQEGTSSSQETATLSEEDPETQHQEASLQKQLKLQLKQQQQLGLQLRELWVQLAKTQSNTHLNPLLFYQR
nr:MAG: ORF1 [Torque teno virus]